MSSEEKKYSVRPLKRPRMTVKDSSRVVQHGCPYMDTVDRAALDFDLPSICSVTLVSHNVYACLVCGRFFRGRAPSSPAYLHALHESHNLFINLTSGSIYCLPDGYEVDHSRLRDIKSALQPSFREVNLESLDHTVVRVHLHDHSFRIRGAVGLDTLHASNSTNVVLQLFLRPQPIRDNLLLHDSHADPLHPVTAVAIRNALSQLARKIWSSHAFRPHVAPHAFMQLLAREAAARPSLASEPDPADILAWLLNAATVRSSDGTVVPADAWGFQKLIKRSFLGKMYINTTPKPESASHAQRTRSTFWFLPLDLPPKPLFKHQSERDIVPQVALEKLLAKFDSSTKVHVVDTGGFKSYAMLHAPPFLFLVVKRFTKSKFGVEKNPCVVHLPTDLLDVGRIWKSVSGQYRLIGAVSHEGSLEKGQFHVAIFHEAAKAWFDVSNVSVEQTVFHLVSLRDTYILLYERHDNP